MTLTRQQQTLLAELVSAIGDLPGLRAVVLGGSHARGRATKGSDIDVGLYYSEQAPFSIEALESRLAQVEQLTHSGATDFYEWGPWVNGGAWLEIDGHRIDLLYRSIEKCESVVNHARAGKYEIHFGQQPPFGYFSPTILGELHVCRPLLDPRGDIIALKAAVQVYPDKLQRAVLDSCLRGIEFGLAAFAPKFAQRGDSYNVAACTSRFVFFLILSLFALNRRYFLNDKTALDEIAEMDIAPKAFKARANVLLSAVGSTPDELNRSIEQTRALFEETADLAGWKT